MLAAEAERGREVIHKKRPVVRPGVLLFMCVGVCVLRVWCFLLGEEFIASCGAG